MAHPVNYWKVYTKIFFTFEDILDANFITINLSCSEQKYDATFLKRVFPVVGKGGI